VGSILIIDRSLSSSGSLDEATTPKPDRDGNAAGMLLDLACTFLIDFNFSKILDMNVRPIRLTRCMSVRDGSDFQRLNVRALSERLSSPPRQPASNLPISPIPN
jgi:hypothetical protein